MLEPILANWTFVLVGGWNAQIFQPDWVAAHAFESGEVQVEVELSPASVGLRYRHDGVVLLIRPDRLIFGAADARERTLESIESCAIRVMKALPHTPLTAAGINFSYNLKTEEVNPAGNFDLKDNNAFIDNDYEIFSVNISRSIKLRECTLNFSRMLGVEGLRLDFNFHYSVASAIAALEVLSGSYSRNFAEHRDLLAKVYHLDVHAGERDESEQSHN